MQTPPFVRAALPPSMAPRSSRGTRTHGRERVPAGQCPWEGHGQCDPSGEGDNAGGVVNGEGDIPRQEGTHPVAPSPAVECGGVWGRCPPPASAPAPLWFWLKMGWFGAAPAPPRAWAQAPWRELLCQHTGKTRFPRFHGCRAGARWVLGGRTGLCWVIGGQAGMRGARWDRHGLRNGAGRSGIVLGGERQCACCTPSRGNPQLSDMGTV